MTLSIANKVANMRIEAEDQYEAHSDLRHYHNWNHVCQVTDGLCQILGDMSNVSPALHLAAMWHDVIYLPGAENGLNEKASAHALQCYWKHYRYEDDMVLQQAKSLIESTTIDDHLRADVIPPGDWANMMDADLYSLAAPYSQFVVHQQNILRENFTNPTLKENLLKSVAFLRTLAARREYIYHTRFGRLNWEGPAQANISRFAKDVSKLKEGGKWSNTALRWLPSCSSTSTST